MRKSFRVAMAGVLTVAISGAGLPTAPPALANIKLTIYHGAAFIADYCLVRQSYDDHNDTEYVCTGNLYPVPWEQGWVHLYRHTDRDRFFLDIYVRGGRTARQITVHNGYNESAKRHVFYTDSCRTDGVTIKWTLTCGGEVFYRQ